MLMPMWVVAAAVVAQVSGGGTNETAGSAPGTALPTVLVRTDDTRIDRSCRVEVAGVVADANGDGVIHIVADDVTVEFAPGAVLRGSPDKVPPDQMAGTGIRIDGHRNVTIRGARVSGFKVGVLATNAPGLVVEGCSFDDNFRQHLKSTPRAEDQGDWLWPHKNDGHEWRTNYGAAVCVEGSAGVTVHGVTVRGGQNGIILDRVTGSRIYDNDCSFLSGWGLAMWRSSGNAVCRNALDFCVRGYSHGVYNRGQDSAGLLIFEQCSGNIIAENSITHSGDGIFGFAGREAIGEEPGPPGFSYVRRGCNDNLMMRNDLSFSPAHGLEMTFSYGNRVVGNRFTENAICGIWGGYSQGMLIAENTFERSGGGAYGLERGGVNIEHGSGNLIVGNTFRGDKCGVHLWWGESELLKRPAVAVNERGVSDNVIAGNTFQNVELALQLRDLSALHDKIRGTLFAGNKTENCAKEVDVTPGVPLATEGEPPMYVVPRAEAIGERHPVDARMALAGRDKIIMTEWGPWDHVSALVRIVSSGAGGDVYDVQGSSSLDIGLPSGGAQVHREADGPQHPARFVVRAPAGSACAYEVPLVVDGRRQSVTGVAWETTWNLKVFPWESDPRERLEAWRREGDRGAALEWSGPLSLALGSTGPRGIPEFAKEKERLPGPAHYGVIARTQLTLAKGRWRLVSMSDDGVRVMVGRGKAAGMATVIENWTWHGPTRDAGEFEQETDGPVNIEVEYFQLDGFAVLDLALEPVNPG